MIDSKILDTLRQLGRDFFEKTIALFLEVGQGEAESLRRALADPDPRRCGCQATKEVAHSLKGSSSSVGALHLASVCERLENRADRGAVDRESLLRDFEDAYERTTSELRSFLVETQARPREAT